MSAGGFVAFVVVAAGGFSGAVVAGVAASTVVVDGADAHFRMDRQRRVLDGHPDLTVVLGAGCGSVVLVVDGGGGRVATGAARWAAQPPAAVTASAAPSSLAAVRPGLRSTRP